MLLIPKWFTVFHVESIRALTWYFLGLDR